MIRASEPVDRIGCGQENYEGSVDPLPVDVEAARAYGRVYAATRAHGRSVRRRFADLLIASVALANDLPVVTRNRADFADLENLLEVIEV